MATLYNPVPTTIFDDNGRVAVGATADFFRAGTTTTLTVYADNDMTTPLAPVTNAAGRFPPIFIPAGVDYRVRVRSKTGTIIFEADNVSNSVATSGESGGGGGGGGSEIPESAIFTTGMVTWTPAGGAKTGWVRMNGRTIGSALSSATERANDDTQALYEYLYGAFPDAIAPVSGGRGASAAADFAANKPITVPSMQGRAPVGLDDMGGAAANVIQVTTTASVTNGNANITVASAAGLARGMNVILAGVAAGTISNISGTTITLSGNYTGATATGVAMRASIFSDAQTAGAVGGAQTYTQTTLEMPAHAHTSGTSAVGAGDGIQNGTGWGEAEIDIDSTGGGAPMPNVQPSRLGTFYMKL